ncbi:MAG: aminoacyl-tRNA deacylase [Desulfuromonadales bacterium]
MATGKGTAMVARSLREYLDNQHVRYTTISHRPTYTAQEIAANTHISGKDLAKSVMIKLDGKIVMAVLPAAYHVNFHLLKEATGATNIELAREDEFKDIFPDIEVGAMPPFGNLYGLEVYVAESLAEDEVIAFNAGTHTDLVKMPFATFAKLVKPKILRFSTRH